MMAVIDHIDVSMLSSQVAAIDRNSIDIMKTLLPDIDAMKKNYAVHISCLLTEYMPSLHQYSTSVKAHRAQIFQINGWEIHCGR